MPAASFRFGVNAEHEVKVKCGYFGSEKYFVDDALVHSHWSLRPSGVRQFVVHGHLVQVRMSVNFKRAQAEAIVDGQVVAKDLFAEFNAMIERRAWGIPWLAKVAVWLAVALVVFSFLKQVDARPNPSTERTDTGKPVSAAHVER